MGTGGVIVLVGVVVAAGCVAVLDAVRVGVELLDVGVTVGVSGGPSP